jgi:glycosyltransferase involved in cell wall biosynthesis
LRKAKVLVNGVPMLYSDKISSSNLNVIYTTFESDRLSSFRTAFINDDYDHCIVPHAYVKRVFENSGVSIPLKVIHQGFTRYRKMPRDINIHKEFRIGFLGIPVMRKNLQKLFEACSNLKERIPQIRLHVHAAQLYDWMDESEFDTMRASCMVTWTDGRMSEDEVSHWYNKLSCYVFPSSGEGWSFTPRESLYLGVPTIISDIPVHDELVESGFYKVIPSAGREDAVLDGKACGKWDRIEVVDIENAMLDVYENYDDFAEKAGEGSRWIEDKWTNEETQQRALAFLNSI